MFRLYSLFVQLYSGAIWLASHFNTKARAWIQGRRHIMQRITDEVIPGNAPLVWFHCASLGEFEQGRPVMEQLKKRNPKMKILLTFFSPSGYEVRKDYSGADWVYYLPLDTRKNAREFVSHIKPSMAIFVKYEFWYNYINALSTARIPVFFISVIFRPGQHFFRWYGSWFRKQLQKVTFFFVQDEASADLLDRAHVSHYDVAGDTRFDRVAGLASQQQSNAIIESFRGEQPMLIAGSTWPPDEKILHQLMVEYQKPLKLLIAPHLVDDVHLGEIMDRFASFNPVLYSKASQPLPEENRVLIIDTIGLLSKLYAFGTVAYVGGGFGVGIHNLPEAAVYGLPVVFGPNYKRFREAIDLKALGAGFAVHDQQEGVKQLTALLENKTVAVKAGRAGRSYIVDNAGATQLIVDRIAAYLPDRFRNTI